MLVKTLKWKAERKHTDFLTAALAALSCQGTLRPNKDATLRDCRRAGSASIGTATRHALYAVVHRALHALARQPAGTFVCRFSMSQPGCLVLTCKVIPGTPNADNDNLIHAIIQARCMGIHIFRVTFRAQFFIFSYFPRYSQRAHTYTGHTSILTLQHM